MKEQIEKLEAQLKELKDVYKNEQKVRYENSEHKHFEKGDIVTIASMSSATLEHGTLNNHRTNN